MIIGISGKIGSGKDTMGSIIQGLTNFPKISNEKIIQSLNKELDSNNYEIKKFADALKDCVCILIGCTREQLEDASFKDAPLGPEWGYWKLKPVLHNQVGHYSDMKKLFMSLDECHIHFSRPKSDWGGNAGKSFLSDDAFEKTIHTPRTLLQLLGTECGRNILHPNIWVNAAFANYKGDNVFTVTEEDEMSGIQKLAYPDWIFTDVRFPNELETIKSKGGINIRVNRPNINKLIDNGINSQNTNQHESETSLDDANFDYKITNDGTIEDLIIITREILKSEKII